MGTDHGEGESGRNGIRERKKRVSEKVQGLVLSLLLGRSDGPLYKSASRQDEITQHHD